MCYPYLSDLWSFPTTFHYPPLQVYTFLGVARQKRIPVRKALGERSKCLQWSQRTQDGANSRKVLNGSKYYISFRISWATPGSNSIPSTYSLLTPLGVQRKYISWPQRRERGRKEVVWEKWGMRSKSDDSWADHLHPRWAVSALPLFCTWAGLWDGSQVLWLELSPMSPAFFTHWAIREAQAQFWTHDILWKQIRQHLSL